MEGQKHPFWVYQSCDKHKRLARPFNCKEGFPAVIVTNLINSKILMGHSLGLVYCPMGQSTALLDNTVCVCVYLSFGVCGFMNILLFLL